MPLRRDTLLSARPPPPRAGRGRPGGVAAAQEVAVKRARYPPSGGELAPLVFESGGRPSDEALAFMRCYGHDLSDTDRAEALGDLWRRLSRTLQSGTADMVLSAVG